MNKSSRTTSIEASIAGVRAFLWRSKLPVFAPDIVAGGIVGAALSGASFQSAFAQQTIVPKAERGAANPFCKRR